MKQDAQQKGTELKHQAEQKGKRKYDKCCDLCLVLCISGDEMKQKAGAAVDAAKDKAQDVKDTANKKADEIKPKVNEAVNDAKETGMYF